MYTCGICSSGFSSEKEGCSFSNCKPLPEQFHAPDFDHFFFKTDLTNDEDLSRYQSIEEAKLLF
jgi:hypothetical protein